MTAKGAGRAPARAGRRTERRVASGQDPAQDLSEFAYAALSEEILTGRLAPGTRLTQTALSARLAISRTPVREAMLRLQDEDLIRSPVMGAKPIVAPLVADELEELYLILGVLEGLAARLAARRLTGLAAARLRHSLEAERKHQTGVFPGELLHLAIVETSGSSRLMRQVQAIRRPISRYRNLFLANPPAEQRSHTYHERIVEAIIHGHGEDAERLVIQHMADAFAEIVDVLRDDIQAGGRRVDRGGSQRAARRALR